MRLSNKNILQEHYQKQNLALPRYTHTPGAAGWFSTVTLADGKQFYGEGKTKVDADQVAACQALDAVRPPPLPPVRGETGGRRVTVLVDLENCPNCSDFWRTVVWDDEVRIEAFAGKLSSHAGKALNELYPFVARFHIVDSGMRDAADHAVSVRAGMWLKGEEGELILVSRDRFAVALMDVLRQQVAGRGNPPKISHFTSMDAGFEHLFGKRE